MTRRARIDLHLHSDRSDGAFAPDEVLARCVASGLQVVALTDHDLASEVPVGEVTIEGRALRVVAGAELSGEHEGSEYHLLVYFPGEIPAAFRDFCAERVRARSVRWDRAVERIGLPGLPLASDEARAGCRALTRFHLAQALVQAGHAGCVRQAFARYADDRHGNVPSVGLPFVEAIRFARSVGGLTSWAHPPVPAVDRHLATFVAAGLQGLEGLRPSCSSRLRATYRKRAQQHGLFLTGGSDWHGWHDADDLGLFAVGDIEIRAFLDALAAAA